MDRGTIKPNTTIVRLTFCPAKPDLILIQVWAHRVETWDWRKNSRISILASDALKTFTETAIDWVKFVPESTLIYAPDNNDCLMIVDLDVPWSYQKTSIAMLVGRAKRETGLSKDGNLYTHVSFVSRTELWILWKRSSVRRYSFWRTEPQSPWSAVVVNLQSPALHPHLLPVTTRYSDVVMKSATITSRYQLQQGIRSISHADSDHKTRRLLLSANLERGFGIAYVLNLDTGTQLSQAPFDKASREYRHFWHCPPPYDYFLSHNSSTGLTRMVSVKGGRDLGMLEAQAYITSSGKVALMRQVALELQFGITDISLDELETRKSSVGVMKGTDERY